MYIYIYKFSVINGGGKDREYKVDSYKQTNKWEEVGQEVAKRWLLVWIWSATNNVLDRI